MNDMHTPGLLVRDQRGSPHADIRAVSGRRVAITWNVGKQPKTKAAYEARTKEDRANARRLVACWNACHDEDIAYLEGVISLGTTLRKVHIETLTIKETYQHELCAMERQRDALLVAVQAILKVVMSTDVGMKVSPIEAINVGRSLMVALMEATKVVAKKDWSAT